MASTRRADMFTGDSRPSAADPLNQHGSGGSATLLREVLIGMIEEHSRHLGHVDLLRERIDQRVGQ